MRKSDSGGEATVSLIRAANSRREVLSALADGLVEALSVSGAAVILADVSENVMKVYLGRRKERWLNIDKVRINLDDDIQTAMAFSMSAGKAIEKHRRT